MLLGARLGMSGGAAPLPYDAEVEYLESTGGQWIDTNQPANPRNLPLEIAFCAKSSNYFVGGGTSSTEGFGIKVLSYSDSILSVQYGWNANIYYWNNERSSPYDVAGVVMVYGSERCRLNDRHGNGVTMGSYDVTMAMFGRKVGDVVEAGAVRIYYANIGTAEFIPVRVGSTGYMYDKVSRKLFGNMGSGEFVIGPDKYSAKDYVQSGGNADS